MKNLQTIRFSRKWFNPLYFIILDLLKDPSIRTVLIYGGKSSAKTVTICQALVREMVIKGQSSICFRKESSIIQTTLKKSFNKAIDTMWLSPIIEKQEFKYLHADVKEIEIVLKGLDDPEKA